MIEKDPCKSCGATTYFYWKMVAPADSKLDCYEVCSECSKSGVPNLSPDVYFDASKGHNQTDPNLVDPKTHQPIPFSSKREKAAIMKSLGLRQHDSAERQRGARNDDIWKWKQHRPKYFT